MLGKEGERCRTMATLARVGDRDGNNGFMKTQGNRDYGERRRRGERCRGSTAARGCNSVNDVEAGAPAAARMKAANFCRV